MRRPSSARLIAAALVLFVPSGCRRAGGEQPDAVSWHRFPVGLETRVEPALAVIYSSDSMGPNSTLAAMGYPDRNLFRLHRDHPRLKVVVTSCPANRYSGDRKLSDSVEATASWKALAVDPGFDWIDLAGQGYNHAPPGDSNLNHHEFSVTQSGCNLDHRTLADADYCRRQMTLLRQSYRDAGIPDDQIVFMRFPGNQHSPQALQAAAEAGFLGILDAGGDETPGAEWWTATPDGSEILAVRNSNLLRLFAISKRLEEGLLQGRIASGQVQQSREFLDAVKRGADYVERVESTGGILNLTDRWSETFMVIGGTRPRYLILDAVMRRMEDQYGPRIWYPTARELCLWLDVRRHAKLAWSSEGGGLLVTVLPPDGWSSRAPGGLDGVSIRAALGRTKARLAGVMIKEGGGAWRELERARAWAERGEAVVTFPLRGPVRLRIRLSAT